MKEKLLEFTNKVAEFIDSQSATRLILRIGSDVVKEKFLKSLTDIVEEKEVFYDTLWLNRRGESINVSNARGVSEFLRYSPSVAKHKYVIANEVANASREAVAALLKITEEPPKYAVFIFFTDFPLRVISTIRSRFTILSAELDPMSFVSADVLERVTNPLIESLMKSSPEAAIYIDEHLERVEEVLSGLKGVRSTLKALLDGLKDDIPDFVLSVVFEQLLLSMKREDIPYVFQKLRRATNSNNSSKVLKILLDAILVLVEDIITLKKTAYWKGIKRRSYIPKYLEMNSPKVEFVDWVIRMYAANVNQDLSIFLLISQFTLLKRK